MDEKLVYFISLGMCINDKFDVARTYFLKGNESNNPFLASNFTKKFSDGLTKTVFG